MIKKNKFPWLTAIFGLLCAIGTFLNASDYINGNYKSEKDKKIKLLSAVIFGLMTFIQASEFIGKGNKTDDKNY